MIGGYSPHMRADNINIRATAGEFMQDVPATRFWGIGFMNAVLDRDTAAVAAMAEKRSGYAFGGQIAPPATYASQSYSYGPSTTVQGSSPTVIIQQSFPDGGNALAAAAASAGRVSAVLKSRGIK